jgi:hypothetical protein
LAAKKRSARAAEAAQRLCEAIPARGEEEHHPATSDTAQRRTDGTSSLTGGTPWESYRAMYRAVFNFHEKHSGTKKTPADWEEISAEAEAIAAKYGGDFIYDLLSCVYCELDRQHSKAE